MVGLEVAAGGAFLAPILTETPNVSELKSVSRLHLRKQLFEHRAGRVMSSGHCDVALGVGSGSEEGLALISA